MMSQERGVGDRRYVTLIACREDGFVFSGEQLALMWSLREVRLLFSFVLLNVV